MKKYHLLTIGVILIFLLVVIRVADAAPTATITLDPSQTYQTITGWEAVAQIGQIDFKDDYQKWQDAVADSAVNDLGINRLRVEIYSGAENTVDYFTHYLTGEATREDWKDHWYDINNDNADPNVINPAGFSFSQLDYDIDSVVLPLKQRLEARGEKLYININYVDFGASSFEHKNNPEEYAEFVLATYQHLQEKYGWVPDAWEVILEPDTDRASWTASQVGAVIAATIPRLQAAGFTPAFIIPSTTDMGNSPIYFDQIIQLPGVLPYISEISYHRYIGVSDIDLQEIANRAVKYGINAGMLEHIGSDYQDLHIDLKMGRNSAWQQFALAYPGTNDDGGAYLKIHDPESSKPAIVIGSRTRFLRQYFMFIRNGAIRIEASTNDSRFDPLAFINQNDQYVVVIKARQGGEITVSGLPATTYGIKYTTDNEYDINLSEVTISSGDDLNTSIPTAGVITIYGKPAPLTSKDELEGVDCHHYTQPGTP